MSIESILRWPIYSNTAPHLAAALTVPLVEVVGQPEPNFHSPLNNGVQQSFMFPDLNSDIINRLVQNFLNNNHAKNPILDVDALWADARVFAETGPQWDTRSCLLLLVSAISTLSAPLGDELTAGISKQKDKILMAENYFQASQRRIGMTYHENSLMGAQCSFLSAVYLMSTFRILAAWKCFIQAGSQCLAWLSSQGRLTHDGKLNTTTFNKENRLWQRNKTEKSQYIEGSLYWSCLKSEMEVRFHLKLPGSGLSEIDYLHLYPPPPKEVPNVCDQTGKSVHPPSAHLKNSRIP